MYLLSVVEYSSIYSLWCRMVLFLLSVVYFLMFGVLLHFECFYLDWRLCVLAAAVQFSYGWVVSMSTMVLYQPCCVVSNLKSTTGSTL